MCANEWNIAHLYDSQAIDVTWWIWGFLVLESLSCWFGIHGVALPAFPMLAISIQCHFHARRRRPDDIAVKIVGRIQKGLASLFIPQNMIGSADESASLTSMRLTLPYSGWTVIKHSSKIENIKYATSYTHSRQGAQVPNRRCSKARYPPNPPI